MTDLGGKSSWPYLTCPTCSARSSACRSRSWPCNSQTPWEHNSANKTQERLKRDQSSERCCAHFKKEEVNWWDFFFQRQSSWIPNELSNSCGAEGNTALNVKRQQAECVCGDTKSFDLFPNSKNNQVNYIYYYIIPIIQQLFNNLKHYFNHDSKSNAKLKCIKRCLLVKVQRMI